MTNSLSIVIVDKAGLLKELKVKDFSVDKLYKKCGFKKDDNFELKTDSKILDMKSARGDFALFALDYFKLNSIAPKPIRAPASANLFISSFTLSASLSAASSISNDFCIGKT